jgi:sugar phosphate isomerase/epimerase
MLKFGFTSLIYHKRSLDDAIRHAASLGYRYCELNCVVKYRAHYHPVELAADPTEMRRIFRLAQDCGMGFSAIDCHGLAGNTPYELGATTRQVQAGFAIAEALECPIVVTSLPPCAMGQEAVFQHVEQLVAEAERRRLILALEAEFRYYVGSGQSVRDLFKRIDSPALRLNFDSTHFVANGEDSLALLKEFYPKVAHVHLKEAQRKPYAPLIFQGEEGTPATLMLKHLQNCNFGGVIAAETLALDEPEPEVIAAMIMDGIHRVVD